MIQQLTILLVCLRLFNIGNAYFDAYRIERLNKTVAHGINLGAYLVVIALMIWLSDFIWWFYIPFVLQAFITRQSWFDIPLNLRRGKNNPAIKWDYISLAKPPKAIMDRIEISVFGYNGNAIHLTWLGMEVVSLGGLYYLTKFL